MLKDKVIQRLEEEKEASVKQLREKISEKEKELEKKECQLLANTSSYEKKLTLNNDTVKRLKKEHDESLKQLQDKISEKEEDEKHKLELSKNLLQVTEELAGKKVMLTKMMRQEVELRQKIVLLGRTNTAYSKATCNKELSIIHVCTFQMYKLNMNAFVSQSFALVISAVFCVKHACNFQNNCIFH